jgi:hypothetical protein
MQNSINLIKSHFDARIYIDRDREVTLVTIKFKTYSLNCTIGQDNGDISYYACDMSCKLVVSDLLYHVINVNDFIRQVKCFDEFVDIIKTHSKKNITYYMNTISLNKTPYFAMFPSFISASVNYKCVKHIFTIDDLYEFMRQNPDDFNTSDDIKIALK